MKQPALRPSRHLPKVYLYRHPVDFRKSHRGLTAIVQLELGHDPFLCVDFDYVTPIENT